MVALDALGALPEFETFDRPLDLEAVAATVPSKEIERDFWEENLQLATRVRAAPELRAAIEACLANGRLAARTDERAGDVRRSDAESGTLYMQPAAARKLAGARGAAILIGGYEGYGNYGDLVQLEATLDLLGSAAPGVVGCPVISLHRAGEHAERCAAGEFSDHAELYYAAPGEDSDPLAAQLGLVPAVLSGPVEALVWLYGGGYLNPAWGIWKLRILEAVRSLLRRMGQTDHVLISSGLQIDPGWSRQVAAPLRAGLTGLDPLGVRDQLSAHARPILLDSTTTVLRTGDDALGVLKHAAPPDPGDRGDWTLNLHYCPGEWVADDPAQARAWLRDLVAEIARLTGERIRVQPLIAYEDPSLSERADLAALCAELERESGISSAEPIVLTPTAILERAATVGSARLSVSTSYHVALTSLLLGVPAVLVQENPYYAQKASGLRVDFELPEAAFPDLTEAPDHAASRALAELGLSGQGAPLDLGAARVRALARRDAAEAELTVKLSEAFAEAERGAETRIVSLTGWERDALLGALEQAEARTETLSDQSEALAAQAAWSEARLADITASSSWRLSAPIRRAKAILRQVRSRGRD
jgi:polysaccharide pyruvyl transferase WcaK-like protein